MVPNGRISRESEYKPTQKQPQWTRNGLGTKNSGNKSNVQNGVWVPGGDPRLLFLDERIHNESSTDRKNIYKWAFDVDDGFKAHDFMTSSASLVEFYPVEDSLVEAATLAGIKI